MNSVINTWGSFSLGIAWFGSRVLMQRIEKIIMSPNVSNNLLCDLAQTTKLATNVL